MVSLLDDPMVSNAILDLVVTPIAATEVDWAAGLATAIAEPALPLADWLRGEASFYAQDEAPESELVAGRIRRLADAAAFHQARSVAELVAASPLLKLCRLDGPIGTDERRKSSLADAIDCEASGYLLPGKGDAARLVAWALYDLAEDVEFFHAETVREYIDGVAAFEMAALAAMSWEDREPALPY